jgi:hypothetical protein
VALGGFAICGHNLFYLFADLNFRKSANTYFSPYYNMAYNALIKICT